LSGHIICNPFKPEKPEGSCNTEKTLKNPKGCKVPAQPTLLGIFENLENLFSEGVYIIE
jgi:hypothetical protein